MPWRSFTRQGIQDIPELANPIGVGQIFMYVGTDAPDGFLKCEGQEVLISDYQDLYDAFDDPNLFGTPSTPGYFVLPDFRDRFVVGHDVNNTTPIDTSTIGAVGGSRTHSHTVPSNTHVHSTGNHLHNIDGHVHDIFFHFHSTVNHTHSGSSFLTFQNNPVEVDSAFLQSDAGAPTPLRDVATRTHSHTVSGSTGNPLPGIDLESGPPHIDPVTTPPSGDYPELIEFTNETAAGQSTTATNTSILPSPLPSFTYSAASVGNDSVPPYYTLSYVIKT